MCYDVVCLRVCSGTLVAVVPSATLPLPVSAASGLGGSLLMDPPPTACPRPPTPSDAPALAVANEQAQMEVAELSNGMDNADLTAEHSVADAHPLVTTNEQAGNIEQIHRAAVTGEHSMSAPLSESTLPRASVKTKGKPKGKKNNRVQPRKVSLRQLSKACRHAGCSASFT